MANGECSGTRPSIALALAVLTLLCGGALVRRASAAEPGGTAVPAGAVAEAEKVWTTRCALCHGAGGKGDGPAAATIKPKPRTLTDPTWQRSVDDAHIETIVLKGGPSVQLSPLMPANPDLETKPDVVRALRAKVRSLSGQ